MTLAGTLEPLFSHLQDTDSGLAQGHTSSHETPPSLRAGGVFTRIHL